MELLRYLRLFTLSGKLKYWRDHNGPEIDYVIDINNKYIPVEVKWTTRPDINDAVHLHTFMQEYNCFETAYIICRCKNKLKITERVVALPWQDLPTIALALENVDNY